jgi:5-methyltetrahydropteroyltriglutamate--homocysteine methyltransferase
MKTERTSRLPLFFTQVIGSLPRPKVVQDLLARRETISAPQFKQLLDEMVLFAIRLQEQAGIDVISDGEWRRTHYIGEFLSRVGGFEKCRRYEHQSEVKYTDVVVAASPRGSRFLSTTRDSLSRIRIVVRNLHCPVPS